MLGRTDGRLPAGMLMLEKKKKRKKSLSVRDQCSHPPPDDFSRKFLPLCGLGLVNTARGLQVNPFCSVLYIITHISLILFLACFQWPLFCSEREFSVNTGPKEVEILKQFDICFSKPSPVKLWVVTYLCKLNFLCVRMQSR